MLAGHSTPGPSMNWPAAMFWLVALGGMSCRDCDLTPFCELGEIKSIFVFVCTGPYLIYKSITSMVAEAEKKRQWAVGTGSHYSAVV